MRNKKIWAALAVLLILIAAVVFGIFHNVQKLQSQNLTATRAARLAIEERDLETFKKFVDTDALINQAAEEILTAHINSTLAPTAYSMDELQNRYDQLKPDFVKTARAAIDEYISTGKVTFPNNLTDAQKFFKKSGVASCEIKSISKPHKDGNVQFSTAIFYNQQMKFNFELELELELVGDNWRITSAKGFENFYNGYRRSLRKKLASMNAPIFREMDEIFKVKSFLVKNSGGDEYGFSETLDIEIKADVQSKKPLSKIIGNVILGKGDRESFAPFVIENPDAQGVQIFHVAKTLNPFVRADSDAMKHGFTKNDIHIEVTEIIFSDGTNLKPLERLPD